MKITEEELIEDLKKVGEMLGKFPTMEEYKKYGKYSLLPYKNKKKWKEWLKIVFNNSDVNFTRDLVCKDYGELVNDIKNVFEIVKRVPSKRDYTKYGKYSIYSYLNIKTWKEWCVEIFSGFEKSNSMKISKEEIVEDLKRVYNIVKKPPSQSEYKKYGKYKGGVIFRTKSWNEWLIECFGEINDVSPKNRKISNEDLIKNLQELKEKLGRIPKTNDFKLGKYSINAYKRAFGTLSVALESAGIKQIFSKQDIIDDMKRVYKLLGYTPSLKEFYNNTILKSENIYNYFETFTKALLEAEIPINTSHKVSKQDIIDALQIWLCKNNNNIRCLEYWTIRKARGRREFPYSCGTIKKKFDNIPWEEIMKTITFCEYETINQFVKRGNFLGNDGYSYLSSIEKQVGDVIFKLKQEDKIKNYVYEELVCEEKQWTCDFRIILNNGDSLWLEVDGMRGNRKDPYNFGNEKIEFYKNNNFDFEIISYNERYIEDSIIIVIEERD